MNQTSEEWKSLWPISSVHSPPLLLSPATTPSGPVIFNPHTHHRLFTSPSLSPHLPPPYPNLSLSRFLHTSSDLFPSTATSIAGQISPPSSNPNRLLAHNSIQLLRCAGVNSTLAFFPTGSNSDQIGFVLLTVENGQLKVRANHGENENEVFTSKNALNHRILNISVNQLPDCDCSSDDSCYSTIGYLLACTAYSVHWYGVRVQNNNSDLITPTLVLLGSKLFKSSSVVYACWNPHLPEESLVLLENGELFLFDLDSCNQTSISSPRLTGTRIKVLYDQSFISEKGKWLSCDFSWHPRILIIAHSSVVFLVDIRSEKHNIICLLKLDTLDDRFLAFSIAGPDRFYFTLASNRFLFLCDLRRPMIPVLRWAHCIAKPSYILVLSLSKLRSHSNDATYNWASENGYGVVLGSFWNSEFSLFCYGPDVRGANSSFYAWGLPSDFSLATSDCGCGSCVIKQEFFKDNLQDWIEWQNKKEIVLGFAFLDEQVTSQVCDCDRDRFGGFTLVKLTSFGSLESQRYSASWDCMQNYEKGHIERALDLSGSVLYQTSEEKYKFQKTFHYLKLEWLNAYLRSNLAQVLSKELVRTIDDDGSRKMGSFGSDFHENICKKLKDFSIGSLDVYDAFGDVSLPTSIHEIALTRIWASFPKNILRMGFSTYSDLGEVTTKIKNVPLEFLEVPCQKRDLPPFLLRNPSSRSNKWSKKEKPSGFLVGPVVPVPFLMTFQKTRLLKTDILSADQEISIECDKVIRVANEIAKGNSEVLNDDAVNLDDDKEDLLNNTRSSKNLNMFSSYKPVGLSALTKDDLINKGQRFTKLVFRVGDEDGKKLFDSDCPLKFKFNDEEMSFGAKEMKSYKLLKRQYSNFKRGFKSYQEFVNG